MSKLQSSWPAALLMLATVIQERDYGHSRCMHATAITPWIDGVLHQLTANSKLKVTRCLADSPHENMCLIDTTDRCKPQISHQHRTQFARGNTR